MVATKEEAVPNDLRILHVLDHSLPIHSGYSFRSISLLREQRRRGWHTTQITTPKHTSPGPLSEEIEGFLFHRTPKAHLSKIPVLGEIGLIRAVARRIEEVATLERPDILHAHSPVLNALACLWAGKQLGLPVVYEVRGFWEDAAVSHGTAMQNGPRYRITRGMETYALHKVDAVTTICEGLRRDMLARNVPADRITVIPNGVDTHEFAPNSAPDQVLKNKLGLKDHLVFGFAGSFYAYEGLDLLIRALPSIRKQHPNVVVLLVGGGQAEPALREQVRRLGVENSVRFVGRVPHTEVRRYYSLTDIFIFPRHAMRLTETVTPLKPLEAMALEGIVLASDVGGHRELIRDGETGFLFKADDVDDLVRSISRLVEHRKMWPRITRNARQFVEKERTWGVATSGYSQAYSLALASARQRRPSIEDGI